MSCHTCDSQLPVVFSMQHAKQEVCTGIVSCSVSCFPGGGEERAEEVYAFHTCWTQAVTALAYTVSSP